MGDMYTSVACLRCEEADPLQFSVQQLRALRKILVCSHLKQLIDDS